MPVPTALYLTVCLAGTLHGKPTELCRELPVPTDPRVITSIEKCVNNSKDLAKDYLDSLRSVMPSATITLKAVRCGPKENTNPEDDL